MVLLASCTAETPPTVTFDTIANKSDLFPPMPDAPPTCPNPPVLPAPRLDTNSPTLTTQQRQPLRGSAPGAAQILATTALGTSKPSPVDASGRFCIEVELLPDAPNQVVLTAMTSNSCFSPPTSHSITHRSPAQTDAGGSTAPQNLALASVITSGSTPKIGSIAALADGDVNSWTQFEMWDPEIKEDCTNRHVWVRFDFGKAYTITRFKLRWGPLATSEKTYAKCVTLLVSAQTSPVDPDPSSPDWIVAKRLTDGNEKAQDLTINPESARWAAILLHENGGNSVLGYETFDVAELEVWGQDPNVVPPPPADTCD
ncbi:MAG: hypothetical protein CSA65_03385 [Proteobacteria bacterium]|nr:MAG: hypothetical protein CSA65_03385 [Pseudomonadota bacterium]